MRYPDKPAVVYGIRCKTTGRIYIGCSSVVDARVSSHFSELKNGYKTKQARIDGKLARIPTEWAEDYQKYGRDDFEVYILEQEIPVEKRKERENFWIEKYRATDPRFGYNLLSERRRAKYDGMIFGQPPLPEE